MEIIQRTVFKTYPTQEYNDFLKVLPAYPGGPCFHENGKDKVYWFQTQSYDKDAHEFVSEWHFYRCTSFPLIDYEYWFSVNDFNHALKKFQDECVTETNEPSFNFEAFALDHIETMVSSMIKSKKTAQLTVQDFCCIYIHTDRDWHCYFPSTQKLIEYHLNKTQEELQNQEYLAFLDSNEYKNKRTVWEQSNLIDIPFQKV